MRTTLKRIGALALTIAMVIPMFTVGLTPSALAAEGAGYSASATGKPRLFIDFLGDNGTSDGNTPPKFTWTNTPGVPSTTDRNGNTNPSGGGTWKGYRTDGAQPIQNPGDAGTIFWVGVGMDQVDNLVLAKDGKGIYSMELAFYYNENFVEPYTGAAAAPNFKTVLEAANLAAVPKSNQWSSADYQIDQAYANIDPADPPVGLTVNDSTTEERTPDAGWKMVYASVERRPESTGANRFADGDPATPKYEDTQYVLMIPFRVKAIDTAGQAVCFRQARNGSVFTVGGETGESVYGAWEKNTANNPSHNLKLMLDFMGDLNIWTGERVPETRTATLSVNNGANGGNVAKMWVPGDTAPDPVIADGITVTQITGLSGGTALAVKATPVTGYKPKVTVSDTDGNDITASVMPGAGTPNGDGKSTDYAITMPDQDIIVTVTFVYDGSTVVDYTAYLKTTNGTEENPGPTENTAVMSFVDKDGKKQETDATHQTLKMPAGTVAVLDLKLNSDYNAVILVHKFNDLTPEGKVPHTLVSGTLDAATYSFTMPPSDVEVEINFVLADTKNANLSVVYKAGSEPADGDADKVNPKNHVVLSYTKSDGTTVDKTDEIYPSMSAAPTPKSTLTLRDKRVVSVTVNKDHDPAYQVSSITVTEKAPLVPGDTPRTVTVTQDATEAKLYTFVMPDYEVDVVATFEKAPVYKAKLAIVNDTGVAGTDNKAAITGTDARGTYTADETEIDHDKRFIEIFDGTEVKITSEIGADSGAGSVEVKVSKTQISDGTPTESVITPTKTADGYTFKMPKLGDQTTDYVTVTVTFKAAVEAQYWAKLDGTLDAAGNTAGWPGIAGDTVTDAKLGDALQAEIILKPGYYIERVAAFAIDPGMESTALVEDMLASALGAVPFRLSGNGYNNGAGGTVRLDLTMPAANVLLRVTYGKGLPPEEAGFLATLLVNDGYTPPAEGTSAPPAHTAILKNKASQTVNTSGQSVPAGSGETVTGTFKAAEGYFIESIAVTADAVGTSVGWSYITPPGGAENTEIKITMPAANVAVAVTYGLGTAPLYDLSLNKTDTTPSDKNTVTTVTVNGGAPTTITKPIPLTTDVAMVLPATAARGDTVVLNLGSAAGAKLSAVTVADGDGTTYHVALGWAETERTATFVMPGKAVTATAHYELSDVPPDPGSQQTFLTLMVADPSMNEKNTATVEINGTLWNQNAKQGNPIVAEANPGDRVRVIWTADANYFGGPVTVTTAEGRAEAPIPAAPNAVEFTMPNGDATATVPFRGSETRYTANLVLRGPDGKTFTPTDGTRFTMRDGERLTPEEKYAVTAAPGSKLDLSIFANNGYYIEKITVTPANLGVDANFTGSLASQAGWFTMPAANVTVNVYFKEGWPDAVLYGATLRVKNPTAATGSAEMVNAVKVDSDPLRRKTTGPVLSGSTGALLVKEKEILVVKLTPPPGDYAAQIKVTDSAGKAISYAWVKATETNLEQITFPMPAYNVTVEVTYLAHGPTARALTLHVTGGAASTTARVDNATKNTCVEVNGGSGTSGPLPATAGDYMTVSAAITGDMERYIEAVLVMAGGKLLTLQPFFQVDGGKYILSAGDFTMPDEDVHVYINFMEKAATPPVKDSYAAALTVTMTGEDPDGNNSKGTLSLAEPPPAPLAAGVLAATPPTEVEVPYNAGTKYITALEGSTMRVKVDPDTEKNVKVRDIHLTPIGSTAAESVPFVWESATQVTFVMPAQPVAVEAILVAEESPAHRVQVVVNNTVGAGAGANDAWLSTGGTKDKLIGGLALGATVNLGVDVESGYQVELVQMVPRGTTPVLTPTPKNQSSVQSFQMPAEDVVVYVNFSVDTSVPYKATLHIKGNDGGSAAELKAGTVPPVTTDGGVIEVPTGISVTLTGTSVAGSYIKAAYVLQGDQVLPLGLTETTGGTPASASFAMPAADVEVYIEFGVGTVLPPETNAAILMVTGPEGTTEGQAGSAVIAAGVESVESVEVKSTAPGIPIPHGFVPVKKDDKITVTITTEAGYAIDTVTGSQIADLTVSTADEKIYTFTMPTTDAAVHVVLKEDSGYTLTLHTGQATGETIDGENTATLSYPADGEIKTVTVAAGAEAGVLNNVPEGQETTLVVTPKTGYTVLAAYAISGNALVPLAPALEGKKSADVEADRTAKFKVPVGDVDIYVVYTNNPPTAPWRNLIVIATEVDKDDKPINKGENTVETGSATLTPAKSVISDGSATYYTLPQGEAVALKTVPNTDKGYAFKSISATRGDGTAITPTQPDAGKPNEYALTMPEANVGVHVVFTDSSKGDLTVTIRDNFNTGVENKVVATAGTESVTVTSNSAAGATGKLAGVSAAAAVSIQVSADQGTPIDAVIATTGSGGSVLLALTDAGPPGTYSYTMPPEAAEVTVVLGDNNPRTSPYVATVALKGALAAENKPTIQNVTDATRPAQIIWVEGVEKDQMLVSFTTENSDGNRYVMVTAVNETTGDVVPVLQLGTTGKGTARFLMPAANVTVTLEYSENPPADVAVDLVSTGHGGVVENKSEVLYRESPYNLYPKNEVTDNVVGKIGTATPGETMAVTTHRGSTSYVKSVTLGIPGGVTVNIVLLGGAASVLVPTTAATLTIEYASGTPTPQPWDPDGAEDTAGSPELQKGHITAQSSTTADSVEVTVPLLYVGEEESLPVYHDVYTPDNTDTAEINELFEVAFKFYYNKAGTMTELSQVGEITVGVITYEKVYPTDTPTYMGAKFTLTGLADDVKKLIADGGEIFISATQQMNVGESAEHPESALTQLILPGPGFGPRPYDPRNVEDVHTGTPPTGWIGSANLGDRLMITVPTLAMVSSSGPALEHVYVKGANTPTDDSSATFLFYLHSTVEGSDVYTLLTDTDIVLEPVDAATADGKDFNAGEFYKDGATTYTGAQFVLRVPDTAVSEAAAALRAIMDNDGSDGTTLFITATRTAADAKESDYVPVVVPWYYTISGVLDSYAPTHEAKLSLFALNTMGTVDPTLREGYGAEPVAQISLQREKGESGRWNQEFAFKSSELAAGTYLVGIEKPSHIAREVYNIPVTYAANTVDFALTHTLTLYCGDINDDGMILTSDRAWIQRRMGNQVDPAAGESDLDYLCDLNGDGYVTMADLAVLERNMGSTRDGYEKDYNKIPTTKARSRVILGEIPEPEPVEPAAPPAPENPPEVALPIAPGGDGKEELPETIPEPTPPESEPEELPTQQPTPLPALPPEEPIIPTPIPKPLPGGSPDPNGEAEDPQPTEGGPDPDPI